jgi:hypothetical protein
MTQRVFGRHFRASERTAIRWGTGASRPPDGVLRRLASEVVDRDVTLARALAAAARADLASLVGRPSLLAATDARADAVVGAAADALNIAPHAVRPALRAAIARARALGIHVEDIEAAL